LLIFLFTVQMLALMSTKICLKQWEKLCQINLEIIIPTTWEVDYPGSYNIIWLFKIVSVDKLNLRLTQVLQDILVVATAFKVSLLLVHLKIWRSGFIRKFCSRRKIEYVESSSSTLSVRGCLDANVSDGFRF
jgi:hypothetical protein